MRPPPSLAAERTGLLSTMNAQTSNGKKNESRPLSLSRVVLDRVLGFATLLALAASKFSSLLLGVISSSHFSATVYSYY